MESLNRPSGLSLKRKFATESDKCNGSITLPALVETCFNYLSSGEPRRVMFFNQGKWVEFPDSVVKVLVDGFQKEKSSLRFSIGDQPLLLDFLSMVVLNLKTKKQRSVAWIDKNEICFFPTRFGVDDDGSDEWDFENLGNQSVQTESRRADHSPPEAIKHVVTESAAPIPKQPQTAANILRLKLDVVQRGTEGFLSVQNKFLSGMGPFARPGNILHIHRYAPKDIGGLKRRETFERLIKITEEERGDANVQYAWFGARKVETVGVLIHGFGSFGTTEGVLGTGLYLVPEGRSFTSVNLCDVDEKGVQYMILCRVILGKVEEVHPGSKQYFPSSGKFDSGVDDLSNPKLYMVWPTHYSTYINPEYLVSFKLEPDFQEYLLDLKDVRYQVDVKPASSTRTSVIPDHAKGPTTAWIPISVLIEGVQDFVSPVATELLQHHHQELKSGVISRDELVKKARLIVGNQLLASVLSRFKRDPSQYEGPPMKKRKHEESATQQPDSNKKPLNINSIGSSQLPSEGPIDIMRS